MVVAPYLGGGGPSRLWTWLLNVPPYPKSLAWCHTTDGYTLRSLIASGFFEPKLCPIFGEDLSYFFYGRPAYRVADTPLTIQSKAPVIVVLNPGLIDRGKRLFPFDTGAFAEDKYTRWMHARMQLADFEFACSSDAPNRHVASFFGTNTAYLGVKGCIPPIPYSGEFEVESLVTLLNDTDTTTADDRRLAVELQVGEVIPFDDPVVWALIIPDELQQAPWLKAYLGARRTTIECLTYMLTPLKPPSDYQALLEDRAVQLQQRRGLS